MLKSVGFAKEDLHKPIIGIANTWTEIGTCNVHLREVAEALKEGIREAGGTPMEFNTVTISDGITMGTQGMKASLVCREVIADSIELVARGNLFDGLVGIGGCDKNMPGIIMALCRLDIPGMMLYGGSIAPGTSFNGKSRHHHPGRLRRHRRAYAAGKIDDAGLEALEANACPGAGACGGQFTANTMAMAARFLGISPMQLSGVPATDQKTSTRRARSRPHGDGCGPRKSPALADHHSRSRSRTRSPAWLPAADRPTPCCTCSRSRARWASRSRIDDFDRHLRAHAVYLRPEARRPDTWPPTCQARAAFALLAKRLIEQGIAARRRADRHAAGRSAEEAALAKETPGQEVIRTLDNPSSQPAASSFSKAISRPKAA